MSYQKKNLGSSTKYLPTGDLKQTISRLQSSLHSVHYPKPIDLTQIIKGSPHEYLPILDWILFGFSRSVAKLLCKEYGAAEARVGSDLRFCENCWRLFSDCFSLYPALKVTQFLSDSGFVERKALLLIQLIDIIKRKHNELVREKKKKIAASHVRAEYGAERLPNRYIPQQYFVEKAYQVDVLDDNDNETGTSSSQFESFKYKNAPMQETCIKDTTCQRRSKSLGNHDNDLKTDISYPSENHNMIPATPKSGRKKIPQKQLSSHNDDEDTNHRLHDESTSDQHASESTQETAYSTSKVEVSPQPTADQSQTEKSESSPTILTKTSAHSQETSQNTEILEFIDTKFQQFESRLESICDRMDARMTVLEGKLKFIENQLDEDRNSQVRIRKTPYEVEPPSRNLIQNKIDAPQSLQTSQRYISSISSTLPSTHHPANELQSQYQSAPQPSQVQPNLSQSQTQTQANITQTSNPNLSQHTLSYGVHLVDPNRADITTLNPEFHKEESIPIARDYLERSSNQLTQKIQSTSNLSLHQNLSTSAIPTQYSYVDEGHDNSSKLQTTFQPNSSTFSQQGIHITQQFPHDSTQQVLHYPSVQYANQSNTVTLPKDDHDTSSFINLMRNNLSYTERFISERVGKPKNVE